MSHEPGREAHTTYRCEHCGRGSTSPFSYFEIEDEYWCEPCIDNGREEAWMRWQQDLMENGPSPTLAEQQAEARKLK